jgi:hypothetical protein
MPTHGLFDRAPLRRDRLLFRLPFFWRSRIDIVWQMRNLRPLRANFRSLGFAYGSVTPISSCRRKSATMFLFVCLRSATVRNANTSIKMQCFHFNCASMMSQEPIVLQMRFLQTMREISSEHNTTTFLPVPIDLFAPH